MDDYNRIITRPINKLSQLISRIKHVIWKATLSDYENKMYDKFDSCENL